VGKRAIDERDLYRPSRWDDNRKIAAPVSVEVYNVCPDVVPAIPFDLIPIGNDLYRHGFGCGQLATKGSAASAIPGNSPKGRRRERQYGYGTP
jgi:hypothetical protein